MDLPCFTINACNRCRKRKARCDTAIPACQPCQTSGSICEYTDGRSGTVHLRGFIHELERELINLEAQMHSVEDASTDTSPATTNLQSGDVTQTSTASGERRSTFTGSSSGIHLVRSALEYAQQDYSNLETPSESAEARPTPQEPQANDPRAGLPPRELANNLKDTFFNCYQVQYPILNQDQFENTMSQFYNNHDNRTIDSDLTPADLRVRFMINMVLAIPLTSMAGEHEESHALSKGLTANAMADVSHIMQTKNVQSLQCLLLLLLLSIVDSAPAPVWYISGLCMRMCIDLGYHSERTIDMSSSIGTTEIRKEEADIKRRLFWIAHSFDRTFNILLNRPFIFDNLSVDIHSPGCSLLSTTRRQTLHWLELQRLQSEIVHRLHITREVMDRDNTEEPELELSQWTNKMAQSLNDWNSFAQTLADSCGYDVNWWSYWHRTALLILYRPSLLRPSLSPSETLSCYMAAKELIQLSFLRINEGLADFTWIDLHFQFMSGITLILIIWKKVEARTKAQEDWVSLKSSLFQWKLILERLGARWERIGRAREVLSKLADATVDLVEKNLSRSTYVSQPRPSQCMRETRRSQRRSIIQRLRSISQQDQSQPAASRLSCLNAVSDNGTTQLLNDKRNLERRDQDVVNTEDLSAGWSWNGSDTHLQQETGLGPQDVGSNPNMEMEETLWPLFDLSDIATGADELNLWAYFSAPMLGMDNTAIPNFNSAIRPDESLNNSILNFQGDLSHLPQIETNGTEDSNYIQRYYTSQ